MKKLSVFLAYMVIITFLIGNLTGTNMMKVFSVEWESEQSVVEDMEISKELQLTVIPEENLPLTICQEEALERQHVQRVYSAEESLNEVVFQNVDGSYTYPIHYIIMEVM